jgi:hypothetical protein
LRGAKLVDDGERRTSTSSIRGRSGDFCGGVFGAETGDASPRPMFEVLFIVRTVPAR